MAKSATLTISVSPSGGGGPLPPFYNLRGPAYPWEPLKLSADQRGSPDPEWSFPQFRSLGWNFVRMDSLSWGKYTQDRATWMSNLNRVVAAANANGVWIVWQVYSANWEDQPADVQSAVAATNWAPFFWGDSPYPGTNPALQGLGIWEAMLKDFVLPVARVLDPQSCTLAYKFVNEPYPTTGSDLVQYYAVMGANVRTFSSKRLVYEGAPAAAPGNVGLISDILNRFPNYKPAIYDMHYADPTEAAQAAALGVDYWEGEEFTTYYTAVNLQGLKNANCASDFYRWDKNGDMLVADGTGSGGTGTLTTTATDLAALCTQILGPAKFFV